jgi:hypothetical protein
VAQQCDAWIFVAFAVHKIGAVLVAWPALEKTAAAVSDSTLATRAAIVDPDAPTFYHVHLRYHRVSQGGGA